MADLPTGTITLLFTDIEGSTRLLQSLGPRARSLFEECLTIYRKLGDRQGIADSLAQLGHAAWHQGDNASARSLLKESLARSREVGQGEAIVYALWSLGLVAFDQGNHSEAHSLYHEGLATAKELGSPHIAFLLEAFACLAAAEGQPERATRLLAAGAAFRKAIDFPLPLAHHSDYDRPLTMIRASLNEEAFWATWAQGESMKLERAIEYALSPVETAPLKAEQTKKPRRGKAGDLLTPREREVATLVARGLTNHEIAERLVVTQRTAETHVQNIFNKLGVTSRAEIAAWAVESGLYTPPTH